MTACGPCLRGPGSPASSLASFLLRTWLARGMLGPFIMVDELVYSELAKSFAANLSFSVRGVATTGYGAVYPILIAPAYAAFDRVPDAYAAMKTINSLVMSLAAVPAYFLARRVVGNGLALARGGARRRRTVDRLHGERDDRERVLPVFLLATLALVRGPRAPLGGTVARAFFAALALAYLTRAQAVVIAAAAVTAPFLIAAWTPRGFRTTVWSYRWLYGILGSAVVLAVARRSCAAGADRPARGLRGRRRVGLRRRRSTAFLRLPRGGARPLPRRDPVRVAIVLRRRPARSIALSRCSLRRRSRSSRGA